MGSILEKIEQALKDMLIGWIESNLTNMFTDVNEKVGTIAAEVGQTPSGWNGGVSRTAYTESIGFSSFARASAKDIRNAA